MYDYIRYSSHFEVKGTGRCNINIVVDDFYWQEASQLLFQKVNIRQTLSIKNC